MDATFYATLRALFPEVTLKRPASGESGEAEVLAVGTIVDVTIAGRTVRVMLEDGTEIGFTADLGAWGIMTSHLRSGDLTFDDAELGLRRLAELLGTRREHHDA